LADGEVVHRHGQTSGQWGVAEAKKELARKSQVSKAQQAGLRVVFVTTDPGRDTPSALGKWLKGIDPDFIGLTGDFSTIQAGARTMGISIEPTQKDKNGKLVSVHAPRSSRSRRRPTGAMCSTARTPPSTTTPKDLPKLIKGENP